jgi:hypothetical protein
VRPLLVHGDEVCASQEVGMAIQMMRGNSRRHLRARAHRRDEAVARTSVEAVPLHEAVARAALDEVVERGLVVLHLYLVGNL